MHQDTIQEYVENYGAMELISPITSTPPIYEQVGEQSLFSRDQKYRTPKTTTNDAAAVAEPSVFSNEVLPKTKKKSVGTRRASEKKCILDEDKLRKIKIKTQNKLFKLT